MNIKMGSYDAKTKLPELLRGVQLGKRYTITLRGVAVAELLPVGGLKQDDVSRAVAHMHRFIAAQEVLPKLDFKALIEDGRD